MALGAEATLYLTSYDWDANCQVQYLAVPTNLHLRWKLTPPRPCPFHTGTHVWFPQWRNSARWFQSVDECFLSQYPSPAWSLGLVVGREKVSAVLSLGVQCYDTNDHVVVATHANQCSGTRGELPAFYLIWLALPLTPFIVTIATKNVWLWEQGQSLKPVLLWLGF